MTRREVVIRYEPLSQWPAGRERTPDVERTRAKFKSAGRLEDNGTGGNRWIDGKRTPVSQTIVDLERELFHADAADVVVQVDVANRDEFRRNLRLSDGQIRADTRTRTPAVVVSFKRGTVSTTFACDYFDRWDDNLRAIALGLESLRRLERYHIGRAGDQYRGWQALPSTTTTALSTEQAAMVVARRMADVNGGPEAAARRILGEISYARDAVRGAAARTHPDRGGLTADFQLVQESKRVLEAHFGATL